MFRKILSVVLSVTMVVSGIVFTPATEVEAAVHSSGGSGSWSLVWSDEFNQNAGSSPNSNYWQYDIGNGSSGWGNNEIQYYTNSTNNVVISDVSGAVDGKALQIIAKREGGQITSGRIKTLDKQYVKYGKIEARIKMSNGMQPGVWPAFWMMGNDINTNGMGWPLCGEIDIMEHRNQEREIISTLHWNSGASYNHGWYGSELNGQFGWVDTMDNWHTYGVEWYEDCMKFFLDGICFETITISADMAEEFHKPHFILLNLAIGGTSTPFTKNTTVTADWQTSSMFVDYVRVYQGTDGNFFRAQSSDTSNVQTTQSPMAGLTSCNNDGTWRAAGSVWDYNMNNAWAGVSGYYAGGSQNDFTVFIASSNMYEWGSMIRANQGVTPGHSYNYRIDYTSDKAGSVLVKEDISSQGEQSVGIVAGSGSINGSFTAGTSQNSAQILMDLRGVSGGTKIKITGLTLTDTTPAATVAPTTTVSNQKPGMTACVNNVWTAAGSVWDYYIGNDWTGATAQYAGGSQNDFTIYMANASNVNWGTQIRANQSVTAGHTYQYTVNYNSDKAGSLVAKEEVSGSAESTININAGNGTFNGTFTAGSGQNSAQILMDLRGITTGTTFKITGFTLTDTTQGGGEPVTTTQSPSNPGGTTVDWSSIPYAGDGAGGGAYANQYKFYCENQGVSLVNIQHPGFSSEAGFYVTFPAGISSASVSSSIQGAGVVLHLSAFTAKETKVTVVDALGTYTCYVYNEKGTGAGGTEPPTEPTTEPPEKMTASTDIRTVYVDTNGAAITKEQKVNASIVIMDKVGGDSYEDSVVYDTIESTGTIKVRGNSTSTADKKPYNISFDSKQNVFGMGYAKKWSLLANAFDKSLIRNRLAMEFADALGVPYVSQSTYVDLYVNGEFYGNYVLIESVEVGTDRVDIDTDNGRDILLEREAERDESDQSYMTTTKYGTRFAVGDPEGIDTASEQYKNALSFLNRFETALENGDYATVSSMINVESFVNYYIVNELFKNIDFNYSSTRFFIKDGILYAGPLWDLDLSSGNALPSFYPTYFEGNDSYTGLWCQQFTWFSKLMGMSQFKNAVGKRYKEVQPTIEHMISGNTGNSINALTSTYAAAFARNYASKNAGGAGWSVTNRDSADYYSYAGMGSWTTYSQAVEFLRTWLTNRNAYLLTQFTVEEGPKLTITDNLEINGFQISTVVEGIRTVYSADSLVDGQSVSEIGMVYGIGMNGYSDADMYVGSDSKYIHTSAATAVGELDKAFSKSKSYAMTMTFGGNSDIAFNATYYVRVYAKLADGSYVYTNIEKYSIYDVADKLYQGNLMTTYAAHTYLYNNILAVVNPDYKKVNFNWGNTIVDKDYRK